MAEGPVVLVCDDEELIRWALTEHLGQEGFTVVEATNGQEALDRVASHAPALVLIDVKMPVLDGLGALRQLRAGGNDVPVIVLTAHGGVESAIEATQLGASAYIQKPFDLREISMVVKRTLDEDRLRHEVRYRRGRDHQGYPGVVGRSRAMEPVFETLRRLETVDAPTVLVTGESGTGKDVVARAIHHNGPRKDGVFVEVDCASLPETLIESELFGHEKGAFTDARAMKRGLFEVARGGVVFLDEIGEMTPSTQARLLRALENRTFKRVGGLAQVTMDAAVIAATNRDLRAEVKAGRFREDLFFRLHIVPIHLPPLRSREGDVPLLVDAILERIGQNLGRRAPGVSREAMARLAAWPWPGNVRELRNVLERIVILGPGEEIGLADLPAEVRYAGAPGGPHSAGCPFTLPDDGVDLEAVEKGLVVQALDRTHQNQSAAARLLGISRYALRYRVEKFGLALPKEP